MSRRVKSSAVGYLLGVWQQESFGLFHVPLNREKEFNVNTEILLV